MFDVNLDQIYLDESRCRPIERGRSNSCKRASKDRGEDDGNKQVKFSSGGVRSTAQVLM